MLAQENKGGVVREGSGGGGACMGGPERGGMNVIALHGSEYLQSVSFKRNFVRRKSGRNHPAARRVGADALCPALKLEWNRPLHILGDDCMCDDLGIRE